MNLGPFGGVRVRRCSWLGTAILGLPAIAIAAGGARWPFELAYHFVAHLAVVATAVAAIYLLLRLFLPAITMALFALAYAGTAFSVPGAILDNPAIAAPVPQGTRFDLISFNLLAGQTETGEMLSWLASGPADVLVLAESSPEWRRGFEGLRAAYPYQALGLPSERPYESENPDLVRESGVAILSRLPLRAARTIYPAGRIKPALVAEVRIGETWTTLVAVHTTKPLTQRGLSIRDRYFEGLAKVLGGLPGPLVVAGDFNATQYTPSFRNFQGKLRLSLASRQPATFPAKFGALGIAIDHVLVRGASFERLDPLPPRGSDHRGLLARMTVHPTTR